MSYTGRFAPSPSGRLHYGSLICALGSYLVAKHFHGRILLRIEDLDFYRCKKEYTTQIIEELNSLGFEYDEPPYIQSEHTEVYEKAIKALLEKNKAFYCDCTRAKIKETPCTCYQRQQELDLSNPHSVRYRLDGIENIFDDYLQGKVKTTFNENTLVLKRADGMIAYNLACVVDDIRQGVTQVVRGSDLTDITPAQMCLYKDFNAKDVSYLHLPLVLEDEKHKLSKQNLAKPVLDLDTKENLLISALEFLGQDISRIYVNSGCKGILNKAIESFDIKRINSLPKLCPYL